MAFDPWAGKSPWSRKWQSAPVFLTGKSYGQRSLAGHSLWGQKSWTRLSMHTGFLISYSISPHPEQAYLWSYVRLSSDSVQSLSCVQLFATPWIAARQASLSITNSRNLPKLTSTESVMPSSHLILCRPLLLLPLIPPNIRVFSSESTLRMRWPKYWSFSFSIIPSSEHPGLIFRMDWLDLLAVQGTLKSLLQHHSSKASILQHSAFFTVQLSHPYMTTGKTIALTRRTFVMSEVHLKITTPSSKGDLQHVQLM